MLSGWEFFKLHKALDFHFHNEQYDVIKYNGKINVSPEKFGLQSDRYRFDYYGNKFHSREKAGQFCIANFVRGNRGFIYQSFDDAESEYFQWKKVQESITKVFSDDLFKIANKINRDTDIFEKTPSGNLPPLMQMLKVSFVTIETAVILHKEYKNFFDNWSSMCDNDPYVRDLILRMKKYQPFLRYNQDKIKLILKEQVL